MENMNQTMGLPILLPEGENNMIDPNPPIQFPSPSVILKNIAKQKAFETVGRKVGLPALGTVLGMNSLYSNPLGIAALGPIGIGLGALSSGIRNKYIAYKNFKAINREATKDLQNRIDKGQFGSVKPSNQELQKTTQYEGDGGGGSGGGFTSQDSGRESYGAGGQYR